MCPTWAEGREGDPIHQGYEQRSGLHDPGLAVGVDDDLQILRPVRKVRAQLFHQLHDGVAARVAPGLEGAAPVGRTTLRERVIAPAVELCVGSVTVDHQYEQRRALDLALEEGPGLGGAEHPLDGRVVDACPDPIDRRADRLRVTT